MMGMFLFCLLLLSLHSVTGTGRYYTLKPNVVVVVLERGISQAQVTLRCGESYEGDTIAWRIKGHEVAHGNQVNITVKEMMGGKYTCHAPSGALLNHTLVLVQGVNRRILDRSHDSEYVQCSSKNYSGVFQCSWRWSPTRNGELLLVAATRSSAEVTCAPDPGGRSITCRDHAHCPYGEERERISLALYVLNEFRVERYSKAFYIAEIVKPDGIPVTKLDRNTFEWGYPDSWSTPVSYFPLTFQVKQIPGWRSCGCDCRGRSRLLHTTERLQWTARRGFLLCVRAQDALCGSTWSNWSQTSTADGDTATIPNSKNRKQKQNRKPKVNYRL